MAETGYLDMEGRWQKLESQHERVSYGLTPHIYISDRMVDVLVLLFQGKYPYRVYSQVAKDATPEDDNAFDADIKALEAYFINQRLIKGQRKESDV